MKYAEMKERRVLITGGTQGIGEAMADLFSADGAKVVINGRVLNEKVQKVLDRTGAKASMGSILNQSEAATVVRKAAELNGGLDVLVCNAAGMSMAAFFRKCARRMVVADQDQSIWTYCLHTGSNSNHA